MLFIIYLLLLPSVWLLFLDPILLDGFLGSCNCKSIVGNVIGDDRACCRVCVVSDLNGSDKASVAADERIVSDFCSRLGFAVIVGGRTAAAEVYTAADVGIAYICQVSDARMVADD